MSSSFHHDLKLWGPQGDARRRPTLSEAENYCRRLTSAHYENFPVVTWLLPKRFHQHFYNVYAYCRWADDLGDEIVGAEESLSLLAWWREALNRCCTGSTQHPVFVALEKTIRECHIPLQPFEDLISAFEQDQRVTEYESFEQLRDYCRRSADPVGRLVLFVCGQNNERNAALSDSICTGLQLANFWQDVGRDLDMGRVYLPREDRERFGYNDQDLRNRVTNDAFVELLRFEVERARDFLQAGLPLVDYLPGRLRIDIELFARGGLIILERIRAIDYSVWEQRPIVTKGDVVGLLINCLGRAFGRRLGFGGRYSEGATSGKSKAALR